MYIDLSSSCQASRIEGTYLQYDRSEGMCTPTVKR